MSQNVQTVAMKAPTVVGERSLQLDPGDQQRDRDEGARAAATAPVDSASTVPNPIVPAEPQIEVRRAEPVRPMEQQTVVDSTIKLDRPPPVDF